MNIDGLKVNALEKLEELHKVTREADGGEHYAKVQIDKAQIYYDLNQFEKSYQAFANIIKSDSLIYYMIAQYAKGALLSQNDNIVEAINEWNNLKGIGDSSTAAIIKFRVGNHLLGSDFAKYNDAKQFFIETLEYYPYESYCYQKICDFLLDPNLKAVGKKFLCILDNVLEIVSILKLDFSQEDDENKNSERKLAHYTNTSTTNLLLEDNKDESLPSFFRLNTINNVNDPSEGHLLINYLKSIRENSFYAPDFDQTLHAFISCFTFNHDSLNQFRLYGKENDKEASGVSLVFKKEFFQLDNILGGLSFLSFKSSIQDSTKDNPPPKLNKQSYVEGVPISDTRIGRQPVMRCVYIDPTSNYIQLAQRNRITFFREFGNEGIVIDGIEVNKAEYEWKKYKDYIEAKTEAFNNAFYLLKTTYKEIMKEKLESLNNKSELSNNIDLLVEEILLPLKYLIKHSAFQEEQECRMIYVTSINAPEVKIADKKFLFVEYQAEVKEHLNKVYIAPAATKYQLYLAWLLRGKDVKIELSNNPYRHT